MPTLLAFGDSNTHGTPPVVTRGAYHRYALQDRWPGACAAALGAEWTLVEAGLPGRTAQYPDPVMGAHMDGRAGLRMALESHGPIDVLAIMLGTNDVKTRFAPTAQRVTAGIAALLDIALGDEMQTRHGGFGVLVIAPPRVVETGPIKGEFLGAAAVSAELPAAYAALAGGRGCAFLDANTVIAVSEQDGIHFEEAAHRALGGAVADTVRNL